MTISNLFTIGSSMFLHGSTINTKSLTYSSAGNLSGTTKIVFNTNAGIWQHTGGGVMKTDVEINLSGTLTISGTVEYATGTFLYTAGTITGTSSAILNLGALGFTTTTVTLNATFAPTSMILQLRKASVSNSTILFNGTNGFDIPQLRIAASGANNIITFSTVTYEANI